MVARDRSALDRASPKSLTLAMMSLARACLLLAVCGACGFEHGVGGNGSDGSVGGDDAPQVIDAANVQSDGPPADASMCFGTFQNICLTALPTNDYVVSANVEVNTDTGCPYVFTQSSGQSLCGIVAKTITINARLRANGPRPLLLLATDTVSLGSSALVDVGSYKEVTSFSTTEIIGAGAVTGATLCGSPTSGGGDNGGQSAGGGGGAGGSFGGKGGAGATGLNNAGGGGGTAANATGAPSFMRGGCRGTGGGSGNGNAVGPGGAGGGAVLVIAGGAISNAGHIRAGGMGGYGGGPESGGGGGGSGGMIVLDAPTITNTGILNANGAGGGEGGSGGSSGDTGSSALTGTGAAAGGSGGFSGNGGNGAWASTLTGGGGATGSGGGGAGGGGAGVIRIYPAQALAGTVSPSPS